MIRRITSDLASFKSLDFKPGLNILLADKSPGATDRQTRNGAGKTSLIELIHFLLGASVDKRSIFKSEKLVEHSFEMSFDLGATEITVARSGAKPTRVRLQGETSDWPIEPRLNQSTGFLDLSNDDWKAVLGAIWFGLPIENENDDARVFGPTFRMLFSYFARRVLSGGFFKPSRYSTDQQLWDEQVALSYLIGIDWTQSQRLQEHRKQEKTAMELRRAARGGDLGPFFAKASELRTKLVVAEAKAARIKEDLNSFQVIPQYRELEREASSLTQEISGLSNDTTVDRELVLDLRKALLSEPVPSTRTVEALYTEASIVLPEAVRRRFTEVETFHNAIIENRKSHLGGELDAAEVRIAGRERRKEELDIRRRQIMTILQSGQALDSYNALRNEVGRADADVEILRQRLELAERLERTKAELDVEKAQITKALKDDIVERSEYIREAVLIFETLSESLYEKAGSLEIADSPNGPVFEVRIDSQRSKGIATMQIFCFDMMLMELGKRHDRCPGLLIHDSHLFDGVDSRQIAKALQLGAHQAEKIGFQYIVTMNSDAMPVDGFDKDFDISGYLLPVKLTDAIETGGLFGLHFE
jgi:uncharacterized protein YydD (DUF2326 family)